MGMVLNHKDIISFFILLFGCGGGFPRSRGFSDYRNVFFFPAKNSAQCTEAQSKLNSIREQNDFKTDVLQLLSFTNLSIIRQFEVVSFSNAVDCQVTLLQRGLYTSSLGTTPHHTGYNYTPCT